MNWLEKFGLMEREPVDVPQEPSNDLPAPEVLVDAEINSASNIVDEIYSQNNLSDKNDSIYTVRALIDTLPTEMTTAKKQATVAGILAVSGKLVTTLMDDASKRLDVLAAAREKILAEQNSEIEAATADIETLKEAIEAANVKIKNSEEIITATKKSVEDEVSAISELVEFCEGMGAKE